MSNLTSQKDLWIETQFGWVTTSILATAVLAGPPPELPYLFNNLARKMAESAA